MDFSTAGILLCIVSVVFADDGYGPPWGNPENSPWNGGGGGGRGGNNGFGNGQFGGFNFQSFLGSRQKILIAHGVLAALAFVIFFPIGAIIIRLASFPGVWLVHGLFQIFAYLVYIAAFGIGVWMVNNIPINLLDHYHPVIGIVVFVLLFFQPILGFIHHSQFRKYSRRTVWSYGHLWLGRIVITLGIINGGLGMLLATETGYFVPSRGQMIAYGVVAGAMWLLYVVAAVIGEARRSRSRKAEQTGKERYAYDTREQHVYRH
ncbi:hypothetical protein K469DRAFT_127363 [Zopfia rhizophila CBS 207.26]|uniref:Cytochrome b561 domain-containing protein n=1 Tax=Zopfia rhizophila CBS 207.26 TaxID=1314779 RepID=A0A6A6EQI1_9PEZI|nr:hypothetical protein K469DRAFT_127363 [Zopfia rhizophila CBS 207.26]